MQCNNKTGIQIANHFGSLSQSTTTFLACNDKTNEPTYIPLKSSDKAMERACVFEYDLQQKLQPYLKDIKPMKSMYYPNFIASNKCDRAKNIYNSTNTCEKHLNLFRNALDKVIIIWTANAERYCDIITGVLFKPTIHATTTTTNTQIPHLLFDAMDGISDINHTNNISFDGNVMNDIFNGIKGITFGTLTTSTSLKEGGKGHKKEGGYGVKCLGLISMCGIDFDVGVSIPHIQWFTPEVRHIGLRVVNNHTLRNCNRKRIWYNYTCNSWFKRRGT